MNIYLAGRMGRREELREYAEELMGSGHVVTARWLFGDLDTSRSEADLLRDPELRMVANGIAVRNLEDLKRAELSLHFTEEPGSSFPFGSRHVEFGIALMLPGHAKMLVGPREILFHAVSAMAVQRFASWQEALWCINGSRKQEERD